MKADRDALRSMHLRSFYFQISDQFNFSNTSEKPRQSLYFDNDNRRPLLNLKDPVAGIRGGNELARNELGPAHDRLVVVAERAERAGIRGPS